mmetsp:Transcript_22743/g.53065  ORF Transcript_22743/g.53065 Transcript_22743/m.53065 type:complete len:305 (-) Transcript_22743:79-993(-)
MSRREPRDGPRERDLSQAPTNSIFIGNIPYDGQEEEIKQLFGKVGEVTSVRLVCDKDTKAPKGYAFCDFLDSSSVQAAISEMSGAEYRGRRLRVDYAERELNMPLPAKEQPAPRPAPPPSQGKDGPLPPQPVVQTVADRLARAKELEAEQQARTTALEAAERQQIAHLVQTLSPVQLFTIVGEMQKLTLAQPEVARALVTENWQLCLALQHAQFLVGMTEKSAVDPVDEEVDERARMVREQVWNRVNVPAKGEVAGVKLEPGQDPSNEQKVLLQLAQLRPEQIRALPQHTQAKLMEFLDRMDTS